MPELPEVETIRRDLRELIRGKKISTVTASVPKMVRGTVKDFQSGLKGKTIKDVERRGKLLIITFKGDRNSVLLHLKMTGQLIYQTKKGTIAGGHSFPELDEDLPNKHTHVVFHFVGGSTLFFNDMRKFGYVHLASAAERAEAEAGYGPEPLDKEFTADYLWQITRGRKTALKNVLLGQQLIAGLGNIYVDEACWRAKVKPTRKANKLTQAETKRLHKAIREVITLALKHRGTTFNSYRDSKGRTGNFLTHLKVYGRAGERCSRSACRAKKATIQKVAVGGRGTHYCANCQA